MLAIYILLTFLFFYTPSIYAQMGNNWTIMPIQNSRNQPAPIINLNFNFNPPRIDTFIIAQKPFKYINNDNRYLVSLGSSWMSFSNLIGEKTGSTIYNTLYNKMGDSVIWFPQTFYGKNNYGIIYLRDSFFIMGFEPQGFKQQNENYGTNKHFQVGTEVSDLQIKVYGASNSLSQFKIISTLDLNLKSKLTFSNDKIKTSIFYNLNEESRPFWNEKEKKGILPLRFNDSLYIYFFDDQWSVSKSIKLKDSPPNTNLTWVNYDAYGYDSDRFRFSHDGLWLVCNNLFKDSLGYFYSITDLYKVDWKNSNINYYQNLFYKKSKLLNILPDGSSEVNSGENLYSIKQLEFSPSNNNLYAQTFRFSNDSRNMSEEVSLIQFSFNLISNVFDFKGELAGMKHLIGENFAFVDIKLGPDGNIYFSRRVLHDSAPKSNYIGYIKYSDSVLSKLKINYRFLSGIEIFTKKMGDPLTIGEEMPFAPFPVTPGNYHKAAFQAHYSCNKGTFRFINFSDTSWFKRFTLFFGDGDSLNFNSSINSFSHQYPTSGSYLAKIKAFSAQGGFVWYADSVIVPSFPLARFKQQNTQGCQWIAFQFSDSSFLPPSNRYQWHWNFGDGDDTVLFSNRLPMPSNGSIFHTYTQSGNFSIQLVVSDGVCFDTFIKNEWVNIKPAPQPGIAVNNIVACQPGSIALSYAHQDSFAAINWKGLHQRNLAFSASGPVLDFSPLAPGAWTFTQEIIGHTGCVTRDTLHLWVKGGVYNSSLPINVVSFENNRTLSLNWNRAQNVLQYLLYKDQQLLTELSDTFFLDQKESDFNRSHSYFLRLKDSCNEIFEPGPTSTPMWLNVSDSTSSSVNNNLPVALLSWNPYQGWALGINQYSVESSPYQSYSWSNISSSNDTLASDPNFIELGKPGKCYQITALSNDPKGWTSKSNTVCLGYRPTLFVPNTISPNQDLLNDEFEIVGFGFDQINGSIFNRWGEKIHQFEGIGKVWTPNYNIPLGVYVVYIQASAKGKNYQFRLTLNVIK